MATTNLASAKRFYAGVFDWEFEDVTDNDGGYAVARRSGMPVAGVAQVPENNVPLWGVMLYASNVEEAYAQAVAAGGQEALSPREVEPGVWMAIVVDPCGATIGFKNSNDEIALFAAGEPSTPVWYELMSGREWEQTLDFYHRAAGWDIRTSSATDGFRFAVGEIDNASVAGMWDSSKLIEDDAQLAKSEAPSLWTVYMGVKDMKEALAKTEEFGGKVARQPWESDFGVMATITDPEGAVLNLCEVDEYVPSEEEVHEPDLFAPEDFQAK